MFHRLVRWWRENNEWFQILKNLERIEIFRKSNGTGASVFQELQRRHQECLTERDRMAKDLQASHKVLDGMNVPRCHHAHALLLTLDERLVVLQEMNRNAALIIRYRSNPDNPGFTQPLVEWLDGLGVTRFDDQGQQLTIQQRLDRLPLLFHDWVTRIISEDLSVEVLPDNSGK